MNPTYNCMKTKKIAASLNFKIFGALMLSIFSLNILAQGNGVNSKFTKGGDNLTSNEAVIGSTNNVDFKFLTNNQTRLVIDATGVMRLVNLAGSGTRLVTTDANGNFLALPQGNANHVLFGNGTWGAIPTQTFSGNWGVNGNKYFYNSGYVGIGTSNPQFPLDVVGDARIQNNLYVGGGIVITDRVNAAESVTTTVLNADTIRMGAGRVIAGTTDIVGDVNISTGSLTALGDVKANSKLSVLGNADFSGNLKVNSLSGTSYDLVYSDPQGNLLKSIPNPNGPCAYPIGPCVPGSLPAFNNGNKMCGNLILGTCVNDDFIFKTNDIGRQFIKSNGSIGFGADFNVGPSDPTVFAFSNGLVKTRGNNAFGGPMFLFDGPTSPNGDWGIEYTGGTSASQAGLNFWKPFGSTNANNNILFLHDNNNIGIATDNPTARLTIESWANDGIKMTTDNLNSKALSLNYKDLSNGNVREYFSVNANGYTDIKVYSPLAMPKPYGAPTNERVFTVRDVSGNKDLFAITSKGLVYAREVEINLTGTFPDYVFAKDYKLKTLSEVDAFIKANKHLPNFEKGTYYEKNGINVTDLLLKQQQTIEELMLYNIELEKKSVEMQKQNSEILKRLKALEEK